jgi:hypothetical protein
MTSPAKRKAESQISGAKVKKAKVVVPEYHTTPSRRDEEGEIVWPAPRGQIERAREIIREWYGECKLSVLLGSKLMVSVRRRRRLL